jgi:hypothetical protein
MEKSDSKKCKRVVCITILAALMPLKSFVFFTSFRVQKRGKMCLVK